MATKGVKASLRKPGESYRDIPLWWHPRGGWTRKIAGNLYSFGNDAKTEVAEYDRVRDSLQVGHQTKRQRRSGVTIAELCNEFLIMKHNRVNAGELSPLAFRKYPALS